MNKSIILQSRFGVKYRLTRIILHVAAARASGSTAAL